MTKVPDPRQLALITGAIVAPFVGSAWSVRAFIQRAITTTIS